MYNIVQYNIFYCKTGYYRINYDLENWHKITRYLNSVEYKNMSVINRAKIIDDAFHLAMAHELNVSIFWELTKYLSQETNYVAWYPMIKVFEYMSTIFPFSSYINIKVMISKYYLQRTLNFFYLFIYLFIYLIRTFRFWMASGFTLVMKYNAIQI